MVVAGSGDGGGGGDADADGGDGGGDIHFHAISLCPGVLIDKYHLMQKTVRIG